MNLFEVFKIGVNKKNGIDSLAVIGLALAITVLFFNSFGFEINATNVVIGTVISLSIIAFLSMIEMTLAIMNFKKIVRDKSNKSEKNEKYIEAYKVNKLIQNILNSDTYTISSFEIREFKKLLKKGDITVEGLIKILTMLLEDK